MSKRLSGKSKAFWYDRWLLLSTLALMALGLIMVASASMVVSDREYGYAFHFLFRQAAYLVIGLGAALVVTRIKLSLWQKYSGYLLLFAVGLLLIVLVPGVGRQVNGSTRWIGLGPLGIQVSEFAKFAVVVFLAGYLVRRELEVRSQFIGFVKPLLIMGVIGFFLLLEPDFGATAVIFATAMAMLFLARARLWQFILLIGIVAGAMALLAISAPYRLERLTTFMNPWATQFGGGYQLTQSLIAFGRGGIFGVGLGNSIQKLFYLPEAHTDFLFAVLAEELGLLGEMAVIILFAIFVGRAFRIGYVAERLHRRFDAYLCYGFAFWLGLQAMINIGVNAGVLPTKGLTLPLMSYGGSSMVLDCIVIAMLLRVSHENKIGSRGAAPSSGRKVQKVSGIRQSNSVRADYSKVS